MEQESERTSGEAANQRTDTGSVTAPVDGAAADSSAHLHSQIRAARSEIESQVAHARAEFEVANERIKARTGRNLILAIVIALAIGGVLLGSLLFFKSLFVIFALAASILGTIELSRAMNGSGHRVDVAPQLVAGSVLILTGYFFDSWMLWIAVFIAVATVIVWRLVAQMMARDGRDYSDVLSDALVSGFVQLYAPFLASICVVLVRQEHGEWWVLGFVCVVVAADTGAYAAGLTFGKHPMAPLISPKKTWEGFTGAVIAAVGIAMLISIFMLGLPWWFGFIFGLVILATATFGDLGESMIKRDLGIKDMSSWLPGHGGILDRLDSVLPSTAAALGLYYLFYPLAVL
ncbi:phosphatidate cytidylyltransferase [Microbacterium sp. NPDC076911]|uniref:phosphatidate cytidylyltransferase n=1 Tax=Microbacterium sp. NPDC076911 TaxID=3154958 RepID=UPI003443C53D